MTSKREGFFVAGVIAIASVANSQTLPYPTTKKDDVVDVLHGVKVPDPYRWLEDADSAETKAWVDAQNKVTFGYLKTIPERAAIESKLTKLWNYEKYSTPFRKGGRIFFTKNDGLQNQSVLYVSESLGDTPKVLLDPNKLSDDGTISLSGTSVSNDGKYLAYSTSSGGSDWEEWRVRDIDSGKDLSDHLQWVKFSGASWTKDGSGFYYSRYAEPKGAALSDTNYFQKLYFHKLGTPQSEDTLVYERPDQKEWGFDGRVTNDGRYLIIGVWQGTATENRVFYKDLGSPHSEVVELLPNADAAHTFLGNISTTFYFHLVDADHPLGRVARIDAMKPDGWTDVIPTQKDTLVSASLMGGKLIANYLQDAHSAVKVYDLHGQLQNELNLPGIGSADGFGGDQSDSETFYTYASYTFPPTVFHYDVATGKSTVFKQPAVAFDSSKYETKQLFFESKDGTRVPMFVTAKKGLELDGTNPVLMYGYGGFNVNETPYFSVSRAVWLEMGGVYADVVLRGGSEYGEEWHKAAMKDKKQNVFDDFIAAGEYLVREKYTQPSRLAIQGGSNGGLLVGAVLNQRPDLFGAALPAVGVMDMLRFHKFTIGWAWTSEYGSPDNAEDFKAIYAYSPLHNIKPGTHYPATLITTADHDDRVVPAHSFKYAATLQVAQGGDAPILIRIETRAGHGGGKPTAKIIEEYADLWAFLVKNLHMELPKGFG